MENLQDQPLGSPAFPSGNAFGSGSLYYSSTMYELQP
jgi:hypothetical protein